MLKIGDKVKWSKKAIRRFDSDSKNRMRKKRLIIYDTDKDAVTGRRIVLVTESGKLLKNWKYEYWLEKV